MNNSVTSAKITKAVTCIVGVILFILMATGYFILKKFGVQPENIRILLIAFYLCCPAGWAVIISIFRMMTDIISGEVFTEKTVRLIRLLSWCCAYVALICIVTGFFYIPLWIFGLGATFMTLILRVLKNVMQRAVEIKDENELTV